MCKSKSRGALPGAPTRDNLAPWGVQAKSKYSVKLKTSEKQVARPDVLKLPARASFERAGLRTSQRSRVLQLCPTLQRGERSLAVSKHWLEV